MASSADAAPALPPLQYADLGRPAVDLLSRDFVFTKRLLLRFTSDGRVVVDASLAVDPSLTLAVSAEDGRQEAGKTTPQSHGTISLLYANKLATLTTKLDVVNGPTAHGTALFRFGRWGLGGACQVNTQLDDKGRGPELVDRSGGIGYFGDGWQASAVTAVAGKDTSTASLTFLHALSPDLSVAASVDYSNKMPEPAINVGSLCKLQSDSYVKAKVNNQAVLSLAFYQQMSKAVGLTFAAQIDTKHINSAPSPSSAGHKFGVSLTLTP
ncbi:eukaryotic porin-domain-containing protein [Tribonema minus]|uniref:Eukaryotic porin-domain-containing protein n=1 Tax=Tribonema minus TaxID=303371 RepID=A0A836CMQ3_9STRA|nr:eukaryotic porin-domain-containing protein [Tribonema minus]